MTNVYATVRGQRLGATLDVETGRVAVWLVNGRTLGLYKIERFAGAKLTTKTLIELFTPRED